MYEPAIIPLPSYLLDTGELEDMLARLVEIDAEADEPCERAAAAVVAIHRELAKRGRPVTL